MRERDLQSRCLAWLKENHPDDICAANIHGGGWSAKGFPDLILCIRGKYVAFELKVGTNGMQSDQRIWARRIIRAGGKHYTPRTVAEFTEIVERICNE